MKKTIAIAMLLIMAFMMLAACSSSSDDSETSIPSGLSAENPRAILVNSLEYNSFSAPEQEHWYKFTLTSMAEITLYLTYYDVPWGSKPSTAYWTVSIYEPDGETIINYFSSEGNDHVYFGAGYLEAGTYLAKVTANSTDNSQYYFKVEKKHDCEGKYTVIEEPTCTEEGMEEKLCMICDVIIDTRAIPAKGHTSDLWTVDIAPTCSSEGSRHGHCTVCNEDVIEKIAKTDHMLGAWTVVKAATCEAEGSEERACSHCSYKEEQSIEQLRHRFDDWENVSGNILIPPIVREQDCELCGYTDTVEDWGYVWVTVIAGIVLIGLGIGIVAYIKAYK